jgi:hypothetical protein
MHFGGAPAKGFSTKEKKEGEKEVREKCAKKNRCQKNWCSYEN